MLRCALYRLNAINATIRSAVFSRFFFEKYYVGFVKCTRYIRVFLLFENSPQIRIVNVHIRVRVTNSGVLIVIDGIEYYSYYYVIVKSLYF